MPYHTVEQGEHLSRIAAQYGFLDYHTVWEAGENADLRKLRKDPNVLFPGDRLFIPERQDKQAPAPTGQFARFVVPVQKLKLRLVVLGWDKKPIRNVRCVLEIDGQRSELHTDDNGLLEREIATDANAGTLTIQDISFPVRIGNLDPADEISGYRARLANLGYRPGSSDDPADPELRSAIEEFQCDHPPLTVDGVCGKQTQTKLVEVHGS
jgi:hypothetical protein